MSGRKGQRSRGASASPRNSDVARWARSGQAFGSKRRWRCRACVGLGSVAVGCVGRGLRRRRRLLAVTLAGGISIACQRRQPPGRRRLISPPHRACRRPSRRRSRYCAWWRPHCGAAHRGAALALLDQRAEQAVPRMIVQEEVERAVVWLLELQHVNRTRRSARLRADERGRSLQDLPRLLVNLRRLLRLFPTFVDGRSRLARLRRSSGACHAAWR